MGKSHKYKNYFYIYGSLGDITVTPKLHSVTPKVHSVTPKLHSVTPKLHNDVTEMSPTFTKN